MRRSSLADQPQAKPAASSEANAAGLQGLPKGLYGSGPSRQGSRGVIRHVHDLPKRHGAALVAHTADAYDRGRVLRAAIRRPRRGAGRGSAARRSSSRARSACCSGPSASRSASCCRPMRSVARHDLLSQLLPSSRPHRAGACRQERARHLLRRSEPAARRGRSRHQGCRRLACTKWWRASRRPTNSSTTPS